MSEHVVVYDLGGGIGVCLINGDPLRVAEATVEPLRVLPQSIREVKGVRVALVDIDSHATDQDIIDRLAQQVMRLRRRVDEYPWTRHSPRGADVRELRSQVATLIMELEALL